MRRIFYKADLKKVNLNQDRTPAPEAYANIVSSEIEGDPGMHAPVIDLDFPARLVPSTTEGHFHLYLDKPVEWEKYLAVLEAMADAGLVEPGYLICTKARGASFVRKPGVAKEPGDTNSANDLITWMKANKVSVSE